MSRLDQMNHFQRAIFARRMFGTIRIARNAAWGLFLKGLDRTSK